MLGAAIVVAGCGGHEQTDAPTSVPAVLQPPGAARSGVQMLAVPFRATGASGEALDYDGKVSDWYAKKLGGSVTGSDGDAVTFRRYRGRYSGQVKLGPVTNHLPSNYPTMTVTVLLRNRGGRLTRVPSGFPVMEPDMDPDPLNPAALQQSYRLAPDTAPRSLIAHYRRLLDGSITGQRRTGSTYEITFEDFRGASGTVTVGPLALVLRLRK